MILNKILAIENESTTTKVKYLTGFLFKVMGTFYGKEKEILFRLAERTLQSVEGLRLNYEKDPQVFQIMLIFCFSKIQRVGHLEHDGCDQRDWRQHAADSRVEFQDTENQIAPKRWLSKIDRLECSRQFIELLHASLDRNKICPNFLANLLLSFMSDSLYPTQLRIMQDMFCSFLPQNYHFRQDSFQFFSTCLEFLEKNLLQTVDALKKFDASRLGRSNPVGHSERKIAHSQPDRRAEPITKSTVFLSKMRQKKNPYEKSANEIFLKTARTIKELLLQHIKEDYESVLQFDFRSETEPKIELELDRGSTWKEKTKPYSFSFFCHFDYHIRPSSRHALNPRKAEPGARCIRHPAHVQVPRQLLRMLHPRRPSHLGKKHIRRKGLFQASPLRNPQAQTRICVLLRARTPRQRPK